MHAPLYVCVQTSKGEIFCVVSSMLRMSLVKEWLEQMVTGHNTIRPLHIRECHLHRPTTESPKLRQTLAL